MLGLQFKQTNQFLNYFLKKSNMLLLKFCLSLLFLYLSQNKIGNSQCNPFYLLHEV